MSNRDDDPKGKLPQTPGGYNESIDETTSTTDSEKATKEYLVDRIGVLTNCTLLDTDLWEATQDELKGFREVDLIQYLDTTTMRQLRSFLRRRGVWVSKEKPVSTALYETVTERRKAEWLLEEVERTFEEEGFKSRVVIGIWKRLQKKPKSRTPEYTPRQTRTTAGDHENPENPDELGQPPRTNARANVISQQPTEPVLPMAPLTGPNAEYPRLRDQTTKWGMPPIQEELTRKQPTIRGGQWNPTYQEKFTEYPHPPGTSQSQTQGPTSYRFSRQNPLEQYRALSEPTRERERPPTYASSPPIRGQMQEPIRIQSQEPLPRDYQQHRQPIHGNYQTTQPLGRPLRQDYGREIGNITKMYTEDQKYGGAGDNFDFKLTIFKSTCVRAGLPDEERIKAFPTMLKARALVYYYSNDHACYGAHFESVCDIIRQYFEGDEYKRGVLIKWNDISLQYIIDKNTGKSTEECLDILLDNLQNLQLGLTQDLKTDGFIHNKILLACRTHPACVYACFKPAITSAGLINDLRASIATYEAANQKPDTRGYIAQDEGDGTQEGIFFTDRRYHGQRGRQQGSAFRKYPPRDTETQRWKPKQPRGLIKCWICKQEGCHSTKHTKEEQDAESKRYQERFRQYIAECEGDPNDNEEPDEEDHAEAWLLEMHDQQGQEPYTNIQSSSSYLTAFGTIPEGRILTNELSSNALHHALTKWIPKDQEDPFTLTVSTKKPRYNNERFHGVMIDTGAARFSTTGYGQYTAFKNTFNSRDMDTSRAGDVIVHFGIGTAKSLGACTIETPVGTVTFHVMQTDTPFLLSLADMDRLGIFLNNIKNVVVNHKTQEEILITRQFGHPFMIWGAAVQSFMQATINTSMCNLTEPELRQLHRRFGHPSVNRLHDLLTRAGQEDVSRDTIKRISRICEYCQKHGKSPGRFKFTLRKDTEFNHSIFVDVMYIQGSPILHVVDESTRFQAARWLLDMTAKHTWETLRLCWIDVYTGPPEYIVNDAGTNFDSKEFKQYATTMAITTKTVPVEAHWSIGLVEKYHTVLRRAYMIVAAELGSNTTFEKTLALQIAVKATNDTAGPDGLVPTLLTFGAFPRMTAYDAPTPTIAERSRALTLAMQEVRKARAEQQVKDAMKQRNGPDRTALHDLGINSDVLVWREGNKSGSWKGPYKLLFIEGHTCRVQMPNGVREFRTTAVKPYHQDPDSNLIPDDNPTPVENNTPRPRTPGRIQVVIPSRRREPDINVYLSEPTYVESRLKEINGLLEMGVFEVVNISNVPQGARIFGSRFVDEIKNIGTEKAFEKSRLVIKAFNDNGKDQVLTQPPTIQRMSQRIILALTPTFQAKGMELYLRDITQAYVQSTTNINREFYAKPPKEMNLHQDSVVKVIKPLYGIPEAGNHWYNTYHQHHTDKLAMEPSTYDPCLLVTHKRGVGIVGLQTDDTLLLSDSIFAKAEENELRKAKFIAKAREMLTPKAPIKFNGAIVVMEGGSITITQTKLCKNLSAIQLTPLDITSSRGDTRKGVTPKDQYVSQRARGAYIASVCQPESAFDLSFAAQVIDPKLEDFKTLNKRIQWQIDNHSRGLRYVQLDEASLKLIVFTDASYANNNDKSSQIGFVIVLADKHNNANIIHWSSIKCKRVTRSVLASELYAMAHGFDTGIVLKTTLEKILDKPLPIVVCTDSKSLYDCLVRLGTTQEKRLMVDVMCLRQSYERRQITEVKWIAGDTNPADAMTKGTKACSALTDLIDTNKVNLDVTGWVERTE